MDEKFAKPQLAKTKPSELFSNSPSDDDLFATKNEDTISKKEVSATKTEHATIEPEPKVEKPIPSSSSPAKLNINPLALLPGAKPPSKATEPKSVISSNNIEAPPKQNVISRSKNNQKDDESGSVLSFDKPSETRTLSTKARVSGPKRSKPSRWKGSEKSVPISRDEVEKSSAKEFSIPQPKKEDANLFSSSSPDEDDLFSNSVKNEATLKPKEPVVTADDDDDLFSHKVTLSVDKDDIFASTNERITKTQHSVLKPDSAMLFGDETDDDDDNDLFGSVTKGTNSGKNTAEATTEPVKQVIQPSPNEEPDDDLDADDIFA